MNLNQLFVTAKVVVELAKYAYINAGVLLHPSFVSVEDIQGKKAFSVYICFSLDSI